MKKFLMIVALVLSVSNTASAALIVGNDATNRAKSDSWSNFIVGHFDDVFTLSGILKEWNVFTSGAGTVGAVVLRSAGNNVFDIVSVDYATVNSSGFHNFAFTPDFGSLNVQAGDFLGVYVGTARVRYDSTQETVRWTANGDNSITTSWLDTGSAITLNSGNGRTYAMNVTYVPTPATAGLIGIALLVLGASRRKH
jgi:opacity protein-like surface antigen